MKNKYGPSKVRPDGYTVRVIQGVKMLTHQWVWIIYNGKIPKGFHVHHRDHDRSNNALDNLELLSVKNHALKHRANEIINGVVFKTCPKCGFQKERNIENFYYRAARNCFKFCCKPCSRKYKKGAKCKS